ncbi:MAG TPA: TetR family transcriptional regulator [Flavisolibacter sp.]|nr:TetR family transcriptional regulator [Flavisolibacter sp.]
MAGRKKEFTEENVLHCAAELFMIKGFESTSTEDLLTAMKINKGSLYHSFGSKRELFVRVLQYYSDKYIDGFARRLEESNDPIADIKASFLDIARNGTQVSFMKGCFLGNTILEQASLDEELKEIAVNTLIKLENVYYKHIKQAQSAKQLITKTEPRTLARHLTNLWNGINITARMYSNKKDLLPILKINLDLIY